MCVPNIVCGVLFLRSPFSVPGTRLLSQSSSHSPTSTQPVRWLVDCVKMAPPKDWFCECLKYCKGCKRKVSRATHFDHAPYRNQALQQAFQQAVVAGSSAGSANIGNAPTEAPRTKRRRMQTQAQQATGTGPSSLGCGSAVPQTSADEDPQDTSWVSSLEMSPGSEI
ncbi:hypothetical protein BD311DRAFT_742811 [Dichomitus squalens]|uniref:Uncharacterized protein n=1 Tax=Dichomitus squalens TaxID=114155 RepID=A0A4Q9M8L8_9APHY|nr:hypothetical protein BD311DRAFT_742811 [Dichomitus squalens]